MYITPDIHSCAYIFKSDPIIYSIEYLLFPRDNFIQIESKFHLNFLVPLVTFYLTFQA